MSYSKYKYADTPTWFVRYMYGLGIVCWLLTMYGYVRFFQIDHLYLWLVGPLLLVSSAYYLLSYGINLFYTRFDSKAHRRLVSNWWHSHADPYPESGKNGLPTVDIVLPVCGEDIVILRRVWKAVQRLNYPQSKIGVFVLDDAQADPEVKKLALRCGFTYLARANKGETKKAGNLKYGYQHTSSQFMVIFDADCVPHKDFLRELLPYMQDPRIGIVQSPQYFSTERKLHLRSPLEYGAGHVQEDFYRIIQRSRDHFGGAICVGTNAVYRREALDKVGGTYQIEHSEDVHTGFSLLEHGYSVKYVPVVVAEGLCPDNQHAYFRQQFRWCSGSMSLLLSGKLRNKAISWPQKLCFWSGFLYYINHVLVLLWPFQLFLLLSRHFDSINIRNAVAFLPYIFYSFFILPRLRLSKPRLGVYLAMVSYSWAYAMAVWTNFLGGKLEWKPSHGEEKTLWSREYGQLVLYSSVYWCLYVAGIGFCMLAGRFPLTRVTYYSVILWAIFNTLMNGYFVYENLRYMYRRKKEAVLAGRVAFGSFQIWRMKTVGMLVGYVALLSSGTAVGAHHAQVALWVDRQLPGTMHLASANRDDH
ncbi:MAG TPA: glycosyltransferase [Candidatus Saccharimonadales bacterium]|nr:glycosyltransferase [Candidatus Saccharimonadales bacterium]